MTAIELKPTFTEAPNCGRLVPPDVQPSAALAGVLNEIREQQLPDGSIRIHIPETSKVVCLSALDFDGLSGRIYIPVESIRVGRNANFSQIAVTVGTCPAGDACMHCGET